ncbi:PQ loop repeat-domain-containing protein [Syncephalis plumigaleata]|nr:PQ loop repeat-domain-containing protein [Syncephalis plumigaleata]
MDHQLWSALAGYLSIICWIIVFIPQIYTNWRRKSSDSLSFYFVLTWIIGDLFNLAGVILQDLLFTMLLLAVYYTFADTILIGQMFYYSRQSTITSSKSEQQQQQNEQSPLLNKMVDVVVVDVEVKDKTYLATEEVEEENTEIIREHHGEDEEGKPRWLHYSILVSVMLLVIGGVGGALIYHSMSVEHKQAPTSPGHHDTIKPLPQILGYISALFYVWARIPQIILNFRNKSCEGLAIGMFICCVFGNLTYCASIFLYSMDLDYLLINLPWLLGSGGTLFFDFIIFWQFYHYRNSSFPNHHTISYGTSV